jgi:hypothetical protein
MNFLYTTAIGFAHGVHYRDALIRAWAKRTGHVDRHGNMSYRTDELPEWLDVPTNAERGTAEVINFTLRPLPHGETYTAYLSNDKRIVTFTGDTLAEVTRITSYRVVGGSLTNARGSFWAIGIDGRTYYGRHNGTGMYCRMRLAKYRDEFNIQMRTCEGWETVNCEATHRAARLSKHLYEAEQPGAYRIKRERVRQE